MGRWSTESRESARRKHQIRVALKIQRILSEGRKFCSRCGEVKGLSEFLDANSSRGCRDCRSKRHKEYRRKNEKRDREKNIQRNRRYREKNKKLLRLRARERYSRMHPEAAIRKARMLQGFKTCSRCRIEKPLSEFLVQKSRGTRRSECHSCYKAWRKDRRLKNHGGILR